MTIRLSPRVQAGLFWASSLAFGASSFAVLAMLSRSLPPGRFAAVSAVFGLAFVAAVVPSAVQLRAAALAGTGGMQDTPWRAVSTVAVTVLAAAPVLGPLLDLPPAALALVAVHVLPSVTLGARRGALIGAGRLTAAGASLGLEAAVRLVAGVAMGLAWHATGVAAALIVAPAVALLLVSSPARIEGARETRAGLVTPFLSTALSLGMLMLLANVDVIVAPAALGASMADRYDVAAVPAKGVFGGLLAAGWLAVPGVRSRPRPFHVLAPALATVLLGLAAAAAVVALRPVVAALLGRPQPDALLLTILAVAMALAAGTSVCVHLAVALGVFRSWAPSAAASAAIALLASTHPTPVSLGAGVLAFHAAALALTLGIVALGGD